MIKLAVSILVRALVELALVLFLFAGVFAVVAFRTARRFATPTPDALDKLAGPLAGVLSFAAARARGYADDDELGVDPNDFEYDDEEDEIGRRVRRDKPHDDDYLGEVDWRQLVV